MRTIILRKALIEMSNYDIHLRPIGIFHICNVKIIVHAKQHKYALFLKNDMTVITYKIGEAGVTNHIPRYNIGKFISVMLVCCDGWKDLWRNVLKKLLCGGLPNN